MLNLIIKKLSYKLYLFKLLKVKKLEYKKVNNKIYFKLRNLIG